MIKRAEKMLNMRVDMELFHGIEQQAKSRGVDVSTYCRSILRPITLLAVYSKRFNELWESRPSDEASAMEVLEHLGEIGGTLRDLQAGREELNKFIDDLEDTIRAAEVAVGHQIKTAKAKNKIVKKVKQSRVAS